MRFAVPRALHRRVSIGVLPALALALAACGNDRAAGSGPSCEGGKCDGDELGVQYTEQGWSDVIRSRAGHISEGSQLMPLRWFLALEAAGGGSFAARLGGYGFLSSDASPTDNPHRLPLGFAEDVDDETAPLYEDRSWVGVNCTACHTAEVRVGGTAIRLDGGQNLVDLERFQQDLFDAVETTLADPARLRRFATAIERSPADAERLVGRFVANFGARLALNQPYHVDGEPVRSGPGRFDALGGATNETICRLAELGDAELREQFSNPANCVASSPSSATPDLWGMTNEEYVQWSASVHSALGRNVGQSNGVYGTNWIERGADNRPVFRTSADIYGLWELESYYDQLRAPSWRGMADQELVPPLDEALLGRGAELYAEHCEGCHALQPALTTPSAAGMQYWTVAVLSPDEVGTDPTLVMENATRQAVLPDLVRDDFISNFGAAAIGPGGEVAAGTLRANQIRRMISDFFRLEGLTAEEAAVVSECRDRRAQRKLGYKAASLEGAVWSAPYLHNNSVPTLADLLLPASKRPREFYVGCRDYDLDRLGYACDADSERAFLVDTRLPSGSNAGHEYGTALALDDRAALLEFLKSIESPAPPPKPAAGPCAE